MSTPTTTKSLILVKFKITTKHTVVKDLVYLPPEVQGHRVHLLLLYRKAKVTMAQNAAKSCYLLEKNILLAKHSIGVPAV